MTVLAAPQNQASRCRWRPCRFESCARKVCFSLWRLFLVMLSTRPLCFASINKKGTCVPNNVLSSWPRAPGEVLVTRSFVFFSCRVAKCTEPMRPFCFAGKVIYTKRRQLVMCKCGERSKAAYKNQHAQGMRFPHRTPAPCTTALFSPPKHSLLGAQIRKNYVLSTHRTCAKLPTL
jgi:hypothetical protein